MKTLLLSGLLAFGVLSAAASLWLVAALALSRWRGRQVARWLREHEGAEWPERPMVRRKLAVRFQPDRATHCQVNHR